MEKHQKPHDVVTVLETFGRYHWLHWALVSLPSMVHTMVNINYVIVAGDVDYRCRIKECDTLESTSEYPSWWPENAVEKCSRPTFDNSFNINDTCSNKSFTGSLEPCAEWIYENNNSIVSELNLACQPWKINAVGTIHNLGLLFSLLLFGYLSDRFGRKPTMVFTAAGTSIGLLKLFSINYDMFASIDFFEAFVAGGTYLSTSTMLIEFSNMKTRVYSGFLTAMVICLGELLLGIAAFLLSYWKYLVTFVYAPPILFLTYIFLIDESPKWQVLNGKTEEAKRVIEKIARSNKTPLNKQELQNLDEKQLQEIFNIKNYEVKEGFGEIFKSPEIVKRLVVGASCRFTSSFLYYGVMVNSTLMPGSKEVNFLLSCVVTLPGTLIALYFMNKARKPTMMVSYLLSGIMCFISQYFSTTGKVAAYLVGKLLVAVCYTTAITYVMELYPTSTRATLIGVSLISSRIGALLAPLTPLLNEVSPALPPILFGLSGLTSSLLLTLTPETKNLPLLETIQQVEEHKRASKEMKKHDKIENNVFTTQSCETVVTEI